jgi:hypothetical protein
MRTEFIGFPEAQDQSATIMCYLMELNMNHGIITNVPEVLAENIGKSILTVLVSPEELNPKRDERLQKYTAIQISNVIVWSFECVQIVSNEFSDSELHPALRTLVESRYSLQPYTEEGKKKTSQNAAKRTMELLMNRLVEAAKRSTITIADEIARAQFEVKTCRSTLASAVETLKGLEDKRDKLFEMFNGRSKELEEAQLQRAASAKLNEIRALFESGSVVDIKMLAETLEVTTKPIFLEYPEGSGKKWPLGQFIIKIPWQGTNVNILQPEAMWGPCRRGSNDCPAPHVSGSGNVCWGPGPTKMMADLLGKAEFLGLISMTLQFLENYNSASPYKSFPSRKVKLEGREYYDPREGGWIDPDLCELWRQAGQDPTEYNFGPWTPEIGVPKRAGVKV